MNMTMKEQQIGLIQELRKEIKESVDVPLTNKSIIEKFHIMKLLCQLEHCIYDEIEKKQSSNSKDEDSVNPSIASQSLAKDIPCCYSCKNYSEIE